jgi:hypothetical protein
MADVDLKGQFGKIVDSARAATDKVKAAGEGTQDHLEADAEVAHEKADAAVDRMKDEADAARDNASSDWQEIHEDWHAHRVSRCATNPATRCPALFTERRFCVRCSL